MLINNKYIGSPVLYDSNGHILKGYYQWDVNQKITIKGLPEGCTLECHFAKSACSASYAVEPVISDGNYTVFVPNEILKSPDNFYLYLYVDTPGDGQRTKYEYEIEVQYRAKPETYIEPTPEERITMRGMMLKAEGYAVGTHDGQPVSEDDPAYENNAKYYAERAIIDTEVLIEEHNHDPEAHEELFAQKEDKKPYLSLERESRYLYKVSFTELPDADEDFVPSGLCSSYVKDGKLYRNLDWNYTTDATFHVVLPGIEGTAFIHGLTDTELDDDLIAQLPYRMVDGKNENGIMMSTHVLYNDWEWYGEGNVPLTMLPFIALNRVKSMATIEEDLADILNDLKTTPALDEMEYLIQVLVTDGETSYVLRPKTDGSNVYEVVDISENAKLSNFLWVEDVTVDRADLQNRPTGVERWNMMPCPLEELRFTKAYEEPTRLSEFIGLRGTTKDSTDEELLDIYEIAHDMYLERTRDGALWQTMHSAVYSSKGLEHLWIQENWEKDYNSSASENEIVYLEYGISTFEEAKAAYDAGKTLKTVYIIDPEFPEEPVILDISGYGNGFVFTASQVAESVIAVIQIVLISSGWQEPVISGAPDIQTVQQFLQGKADLVNGKVPVSQLPTFDAYDIFHGSETVGHDLDDLEDAVSAINEKIPSDATSSNKLVTQADIPEVEDEIVYIEYETKTYSEIKALIDAGKTVKVLYTIGDATLVADLVTYDSIGQQIDFNANAVGGSATISVFNDTEIGWVVKLEPIPSTANDLTYDFEEEYDDGTVGKAISDIVDEVQYLADSTAQSFSDIYEIIPSDATDQNKLVSAQAMGDAIEAVEAKQIYKTAAQGSFATKAELTAASTFYNADGTVATPTKNDVAYVLADESHDGKAAKYVIASVSGSTITWGFVITFSNTSFTQAQMNAINSGITAEKVAQIGALKTASGTLTAGQTSVSIAFSGTAVSVKAKDATTGETVITDVTETTSGMTVSIAAAHTNDIAIKVLYE